MRMVVTGKTGQLVSALVAAAGPQGVEVLTVGRPELDLQAGQDLFPTLSALRPDVIVNAAAYTAVDRAETEAEVALAVNGDGAGAVAWVATRLGVPIVQISTDYVFDGLKSTPYVETDPVGPVSAYGRSKLMGEVAVAAATENHAILRTSWVYAASGTNFLRTMLRLAETRDEVRVVSDQLGAPTYAPDLANAVFGVARNLLSRPDDAGLRGVFHMTGAGETTWAGFAEAIFAERIARGGKGARVVPIPTSAYPTPARRPANSRLDCGKLNSLHAILLPHWRDSLKTCMDGVQLHLG